MALIRVGKITTLTLLCFLLVLPGINTLTNQRPPNQQNVSITHLPEPKRTQSTLKNIRLNTERSVQLRSPLWDPLHRHLEQAHPRHLPLQTVPHPSQYEEPPTVPENCQKDGSATTSATKSSATYWVEAGAKGNGTRGNPAGNITYVLNNWVTAGTYDTIKVKPGVYNHTIEGSFPLYMNTTHVTLTATAGATATTIIGKWGTSGLYVTANNIRIEGFTIANHDNGIVLASSNNTTVTGNTITHNGFGIDLEPASNGNTITSNNITNNHWFGICLEEVSENKITGNTITDNTWASIYLINSSKNTMYGNVMAGCGIGLWGNKTTFTTQVISENNTVNGKPIYYYANQDMRGMSVPSDAGEVILGNVTGLTITNVNVSSSHAGILLGYSSHITITGNTIIDNYSYGIYLYFANNNTITGNNITDNRKGIVLYSARNNTIMSNSFTYNGFGIYLKSASSTNTITDNTFTQNRDGMYLNSASNYNTILGNNISNNYCSGIELEKNSDNIITSNNVTHNDEGGIYLWKASNNTVTNNTISNNEREGIYLYFASNNTITDNIITHNWDGIELYSSNDTTITSNNITYNGPGISSNHGNGIFLGRSSKTTIIHNDISSNTEYGILLVESSTGTLVYRNKLVGNGVNAKDTCGRNAFNTTIGNYWGDYNGNDTNGDGIGDVPYVIPGDARSKDYHPAMTPFAPPPSQEELEQQGISPLSFVIPVVVLAGGVVLGFFVVRYMRNVRILRRFIHHTSLKTVCTTATDYFQRFLTDRDYGKH
ncbi:MAG: hypothetical protein GWN31_03190 [Candidatus Thorarchaeota archaeon]|nr:hypothetical protein [Candidatus Thorarchaeota archaeon]NIW12941.1 hypothetical protein [Candidatus Thorarchaeota archaeon]NIW51905.1 hypothetical protein [Candidatus Korarchaeota archaeon]